MGQQMSTYWDESILKGSFCCLKSYSVLPDEITGLLGSCRENPTEKKDQVFA